AHLSLDDWAREERLEERVERLHQLRNAPEVGLERQHLASLTPDRIHGALVRARVGAAKAVYRLLCIPHDEELPGLEPRIEGVSSGAAQIPSTGVSFREEEHDL